MSQRPPARIDALRRRTLSHHHFDFRAAAGNRRRTDAPGFSQFVNGFPQTQAERNQSRAAIQSNAARIKWRKGTTKADDEPVSSRPKTRAKNDLKRNEEGTQALVFQRRQTPSLQVSSSCSVCCSASCSASCSTSRPVPRFSSNVN